jgi:hypothetical protein
MRRGAAATAAVEMETAVVLIRLVTSRKKWGW